MLSRLTGLCNGRAGRVFTLTVWNEVHLFHQKLFSAACTKPRIHHNMYWKGFVGVAAGATIAYFGYLTYFDTTLHTTNTCCIQN